MGKEFEYKLLLTAAEYKHIKAKLDDQFASSTEHAQINYYYDTPDLSIYERGETLRVRQIESCLTAEFKHGPLFDFTTELREMTEEVQSTNELPQSIVIGVSICDYQGQLHTQRTDYRSDKSVISLDINMYLGKLDYELEIETSDIAIVNEIKSMGYFITTREVPKSKYARFIEHKKSRIDMGHFKFDALV